MSGVYPSAIQNRYGGCPPRVPPRCGVPSCATVPKPDREAEERELLRLHQTVLDAHLASDIGPSKDNVLGLLREVRGLIRTQKAATALDLIKQLNRKLQGWANSQRHLVASRAFWYVDKRVFEALWQWAKRRHSKKGKGWVRGKYFRIEPFQLWAFTAPLRKRDGTWGSLDLFRVNSVPIRRHVKIRAEATEFDPACWQYFRQRWLKKRQGRLHVRARRKTLTAMDRVNPDNSTAGSRNRPYERLEPYAGKLARTVLRGAGDP